MQVPIAMLTQHFPVCPDELLSLTGGGVCEQHQGDDTLLQGVQHAAVVALGVKGEDTKGTIFDKVFLPLSRGLNPVILIVNP